MATDNEAPVEPFGDLVQQRQAALMGMWVFLVTELLLFGGLFAAFAVLRAQHSTVFADAAHHLDLTLASINTAILLTSGLTMVLAEQAIGARRRGLTLGLLLTTILLGLIFLGVKGYEWHHEWQQQLVPILGQSFVYPGPQPQNAQLFFNFYFTLTGLHALHMLAGLLALGVMAGFVWRWRVPGRLERQLRTLGLYWSFVDVVWIFVFTILYLLRS